MTREYQFDRYRNGRKMAEGLVLTKPATVEQAMEAAYLLAGPGEMFVLREDLARLAVAEAERDNWKAAAKRLEDAVLKAGCAVDSLAFYEDCIVTPIVRELRAERDAALAEVERLQADIMNVHLKRAMLVVQRDAAQAGEARAVEALRSVRGACVDVLTYCGPQQQEDIEAIMACVDGAIYAHEFGDGASWLA